MKTLQELLQSRGVLHDQQKGLIAKQNALVEKAEAEKRNLTETEDTEFKTHQKGIDGLDGEIGRLSTLIANEQKSAARDDELGEPVGKTFRPAMSGPEPEKDKLDDAGFKNVGEFLSCVKFGDPKGRLKDLSTTDVGIEIPPQFAQQILRLDPEEEIVMPRANVIPAGSPPDAEFSVPYFVQGSDGANGGVALVWTKEGKEINDAGDGKIKDLTLKPNEVSGLATVNNATLQNWQAAGPFTENNLRQAFASGRDMKFLTGSGVGTPLGILKATGRITIARKTAATVTYEDAAKMLGRLIPEARTGAIWIISVSALPTIVTMTDGAGRLIFVAGDATKGIPDTLLGLPIKWTGKTPVLGSEGDVILANFKYYLIKPGSGPFVAISEHVKFTSNKTVFRIIANIDGQPWVKDPLKLEDGKTTVSPYVILK